MQIQAYRKKVRRKVMGLISGTSADGIDTALVEISGEYPQLKLNFLGGRTFAYPAGLPEEILRLSEKGGKAEEFSSLNFILGELFGKAALKLLSNLKLKPEEVDLLSSHGQTISHTPKGFKLAGRSLPASWQIGELAMLRQVSGIMSIGDFRICDLAAGGQGAPLVPFVDHLIFTDPQKSRAVLNLGGIANLTFLPRGVKAKAVQAFDSGPGNMLSDSFARLYFGRKLDKNGAKAKKGRVDQKLLKKLLKHSFITLKPPKSCGREEFGENFAGELIKSNPELSPFDLMATGLAFTVEAVALGIEKFYPAKELPSELIVSGGGIHNPTLMAMLSERLSRLKILSSARFGIDPDFKEAICFAVLGDAALKGIPANIATGAKQPVVLGKLPAAGI